MRYAVAGLVSLLFIAGGFAFCAHTERYAKSYVKTELERHNGGALRATQAAYLDSDQSAKSILLDTGVFVPRDIVLRITISDILRKYPLGLILIVGVASFTIAQLMSPKAPQQESQS